MRARVDFEVNRIGLESFQTKLKVEKQPLALTKLNPLHSEGCVSLYLLNLFVILRFFFFFFSYSLLGCTFLLSVCLFSLSFSFTLQKTWCSIPLSNFVQQNTTESSPDPQTHSTQSGTIERVLFSYFLFFSSLLLVLHCRSLP